MFPACSARATPAWRRGRALIDLFRLGHLRDKKAGGCPTASRSWSTPRWRSWAGPRLVLLDEPAGGVNLTMLGDLQGAAGALNAAHGATFVVIEHNMEFVMALCPRIMVLAEGRSCRRHARRDPRQQEVLDAYLGN